MHLQSERNGTYFYKMCSSLEDVYCGHSGVYFASVTVFPVKTIHFNSVVRRVKQETTVPRILAGQELKNYEHLGIQEWAVITGSSGMSQLSVSAILEHLKYYSLRGTMAIFNLLWILGTLAQLSSFHFFHLWSAVKQLCILQVAGYRC